MAREKTKSYNARGGSSHVTRKRYHKADVHGGVKTPPYRAAGTGGFPGNPAQGTPPPGGMYASPTNTRYRVRKPKTLP